MPEKIQESAESAGSTIADKGRGMCPKYFVDFFFYPNNDNYFFLIDIKGGLEEMGSGARESLEEGEKAMEEGEMNEPGIAFKLIWK